MPRVVVALGNKSRELKLDEVNRALHQVYGSESFAFAATDREDEFKSGLTELHLTPNRRRAEEFAERAARRYPQADIWVGVKSVLLRVSADELVPMDVVITITKGSDIRGVSQIGSAYVSKINKAKALQDTRYAGSIKSRVTYDGPAANLLAAISAANPDILKTPASSAKN